MTTQIEATRMNIEEIQALRAELEASLLQAFTDFHAKTGLHVERIDIDHIESMLLEARRPHKRVTSVAAILGAI